MVKKTLTKKEKLADILYHEITIVIISILIITLMVGGIIYYKVSSSRIYIEDSDIEAPIISLSPSSTGILNNVFVEEGDFVPINTVVAQVGNTNIKTKTSGIIIDVQDTPGQFVTPQNAIVKMIDPNKLRVVGHLEEDKGLKKVRVGQRVVFTVDAFGTKKYSAFVDNVASTSRKSDIVFSISDKREEQEFDIKAKFDASEYPELKNGMSARMWIYK